MASESSNSSSTSQHPNENKQNQLPNSDSNKSIDFVNLSKDDLVRGSEVQEHNFFSPIQVGSLSYFPNHNNKEKNENNDEKKNSDSKLYSCNYCKGRYSSLQALGGHQNAHKAERALQKQRVKQRPLGVRIESMIHKSPYISPRFGHSALRLHDILHPSLVSGVANLGIGGATTSRNGAILKIGESSTNNVAPNNEEEPSDSDSSGLDLSLKL
ncbi:zinc finger protein [Trifolium pratense]|uniref:Zinc finger protein n=1 Tax=Trifolium pratense TaxID=57577 RepID=A0A2K3LLV7_TRIPR|nr:zinc finger protein [Trifolium pratense]PNX82825.1 zinc finger protein [Trifolium pratense]